MLAGSAGQTESLERLGDDPTGAIAPRPDLAGRKDLRWIRRSQAGRVQPHPGTEDTIPIHAEQKGEHQGVRAKLQEPVGHS